MTPPVATLASSWVSGTFPRFGGDMWDATDPGPLPSGPTGGSPAGWALHGRRALASQDLVLLLLLLCLGHRDAGGFRGCPLLSPGCGAMLTGACPAQMVACTRPRATSFGASLTSGGTCTSGR